MTVDKNKYAPFTDSIDVAECIDLLPGYGGYIEIGICVDWDGDKEFCLKYWEDAHDEKSKKENRGMRFTEVLFAAVGGIVGRKNKIKKLTETTADT